MRPHDIAVLLKIASKGDTPWLMKMLAHELGINSSEVSESIHRSVYARLIAHDKKTLIKTALIGFLEHGFPYVYPQQPRGFGERYCYCTHCTTARQGDLWGHNTLCLALALGQRKGTGHRTASSKNSGSLFA